MAAEARLLELNPVVPVKQMQESLDFYVTKLGFVRVFDDATNDGETITYAGRQTRQFMSPPSGDGPGTIGGHAAHQDTCGEHRGPL